MGREIFEYVWRLRQTAVFNSTGEAAGPWESLAGAVRQHHAVAGGYGCTIAGKNTSLTFALFSTSDSATLFAS